MIIPEIKGVRVGGRTDVGCVRPHNEDSMLIQAPLLVVADGVGGQEAGEIASHIAVETLAKAAPEFADAEQLAAAVRQANMAIIKGVESGIGKPTMATTVTAAIIDGSNLVVAQVGDSRAYILRGKNLSRITRDHSLMEALIESGQITEEEARTHPNRSVITRALGSDPGTEPDIYELTVNDGDRVLLCSDGLHGMVDDARIHDILLANPDPQKAADALVEEAKANGGHDNITVIVANIGSTLSAIKVTNNRKARIAIISAIAAVVILVGGIFGGSYLYARSSAYLIAEDGYVALYKGRLDAVLGMDLSWFQYKSSVDINDLPDMTSEKLIEGIQFDSKEDAESALEDYREQADEAISKRGIPGAKSPSANVGNQTSNATVGQGTVGSAN